MANVADPFCWLARTWRTEKKQQCSLGVPSSFAIRYDETKNQIWLQTCKGNPFLWQCVRHAIVRFFQKDCLQKEHLWEDTARLYVSDRTSHSICSLFLKQKRKKFNIFPSLFLSLSPSIKKKKKKKKSQTGFISGMTQELTRLFRNMCGSLLMSRVIYYCCCKSHPRLLFSFLSSAIMLSVCCASTIQTNASFWGKITHESRKGKFSAFTTFGIHTMFVPWRNGSWQKTRHKISGPQTFIFANVTWWLIALKSSQYLRRASKCWVSMCKHLKLVAVLSGPISTESTKLKELHTHFGLSDSMLVEIFASMRYVLIFQPLLAHIWLIYLLYVWFVQQTEHQCTSSHLCTKKGWNDCCLTLRVASGHTYNELGVSLRLVSRTEMFWPNKTISWCFVMPQNWIWK